MSKLAIRYFVIGFTNMFATNSSVIQIAEKNGSITKRFAAKRREQIKQDKLDSEVRSIYAQARY